MADLPVAVVLVLGDVGRSPRMQYHALSLAQTRKARVFLVGYQGERCMPAIEAESEAITQVLIAADLLPRPRTRALYLVYAPLKAIAQLIQLLWILLVTLPCPSVLLLQTPPAIPTLAAAWVVRAVRGSTVVADWHNLGFSILQHSLRTGHPFVRLSRAYERFFARRLDSHLCVTHAMSQWLADEWGVGASVLHDRPPAFFRRLEVRERHTLFRRIARLFLDSSEQPLWPPEGSPDSPWNHGCTPWTLAATDRSQPSSTSVTLRPDGPALLVSSTSWTADEDFGLLLDALTRLDSALGETLGESECGGAQSGSPLVVAVITGKGPEKERYLARLRRMPMRRVAVCTMWLEPSDYPPLLGSADLGVCLHTSTSGLDLPMKVLDMFGCGLPVCAVAFRSLPELITDQENGLIFHSSEQLAVQLHDLLAPTASAAAALERLRQGVHEMEAGRPRWAQNWLETAASLVVPPTGSASTPELTTAMVFAISRPYFWLVTVWLYLLPTGGRYDLFGCLPFWLGLAYCTLPLNLLAYLMNDLADVDVDAANPRKGGDLLGAKAHPATLRSAVLPTAVLQLAFIALVFVPLTGARAVPWFVAVFAVNWLYNFGPRFSGNYAPLDLICPCGYILVVPLSCWLNRVPYPPLRSWVHCVFLVLRTQLWIQTFDLRTDADAGRRTTAVLLGLSGAQALLAVILVAETAFVLSAFEDWALQSFSLASVALLAVQFGLARDAPSLTPSSISATFGILGLGGVGLMAQVWYNEAFR